MNIECILTSLLRIQNKEIFYIGIGGPIIISAMIHAGYDAVIPATITKAFEIATGISQINIIGSNISNLVIVGVSPSAALVYQKNRKNMGVRTERSRWEIIRDMLTVLTEDKKSKKTRIMQRACLDWRNFQRYFNFLLEEGFIKECDNPELGIYELTENGKELLKRLKVVGEMLH